MDLVDYILTWVAVLLWLSWRGWRTYPEERTASLSLAGTLRRAGPGKRGSGYLLVALAALLAGRAVVYRLLAPAASWTPKLNLRLVVPAFQSEAFASVLTYSVLAFVRVLSVLYFWLLILTLLNHRQGETNRIQKLLGLHLGWVRRLPWFLQLWLPLLVVAGLWMALAPLLALLGVTGRLPAFKPLLEQGLLIGGALYLTLKYLLPALLVVHLVITYVYFGRSDLCEFINLTAANLLAPLRRLPLKVGRMDFAPVVGAAVILFLLHTLPTDLIPRAERYWRVQLHPPWPH